MDSVKKTLSCWLVLSALLWIGASAAAGDTLWGGSLKVGGLRGDLQASESVQPDLMGYQVGGEGQHGLVAVLSKLEPMAAQLEKAFLQARPNYLGVSDLFRGRANYRQRGALVFEVLNERDFYLSVLVSQGHQGFPFFQAVRNNGPLGMGNVQGTKSPSPSIGTRATVTFIMSPGRTAALAPIPIILKKARRFVFMKALYSKELSQSHSTMRAKTTTWRAVPSSDIPPFLTRKLPFSASAIINPAAANWANRLSATVRLMVGSSMLAILAQEGAA